MSSFTFEANLFRVGPDRNLSFPGAPTLVPDNGNNYDVNVYSEYPWTVSDDARNYIPKILLTEYKLTQASELNALKQIGFGSVQNAEFATKATGIKGAGLNDLFLKRRQDADNSSLKQNNIVSTQNLFEDDDMLTGIGDDSDSSLAPYRNLYTTEKTGWGYILPYLGTGNMTDINNTFAEADVKRYYPGAGTAIKIAGMVTGVKVAPTSIASELRGVANLPIANVAGALIAEVPMSFTKTSKEGIKVEFYLLNTINPEDIRKNYEFCYLFTYQNLPNRRAINILDSPPLYRATVIGYKTLPVCYIADLKIENVGAVRLIDIGPTTDKNKAANSVQRNTNSNSNTVKMIPEAYKISFMLQSAFMNSQNMFVFAANPQGVVTTTTDLNARSAEARAEIRANQETAVLAGI